MAAGEQVTISNISIHSPRMGRDVLDFCVEPHIFAISIHSPRMGRDATGKCSTATSNDFNPLSPHGERP